MIEALRWVHANIDRFGGDPANITIAGQSAGAAAVSHLLLSPLAVGLFHRAVIESGPVIGIPLSSLADAEKAGMAAAAKLNVKDIAELRAVPAADLAQAASMAIVLPNLDGKVIVSNPDKLDAQVVSRVPVIAGYTRDEVMAATTAKTVAAFEQEVHKRFGALSERVLAVYPHATDAEAAQSAVQLARDRYISALLLWAEKRTAQGQPVYAYLFEQTFPGRDAALYGAFHSSEVPYVFGTLSLPDVKFTAVDRQISEDMQNRWLAFMRTGDPNPPGTSPTWPRASSDVNSIWRIGAADSGAAITAERLKLFRDFAEQGGGLGFF
jgi:para-nitrobenzyl esterase